MTDSTTRDSRRLRQLLLDAQDGDASALDVLIRRFEPLVSRVAWRLRLPPGCEREDLAQEARVGLLRAIRAWRPERGPFPAFADRCASNRALLALEAACALKHRVLTYATSFDAPVAPGGHGDETELIDRLVARPDAHTDPELRLLVREQLTCIMHALPSLSENERYGLEISANGHSPTRLASTLSGTPHAASQAAYRARRKLAAALPRAA